MRGLIRAVFLLAILALAAPVAAPAAVRTSHSGWFWGDPRPQGETLEAVEFSGATGYASGAFGTLLKTNDAGRTWSGLATGLTEPLSTIRLLGPQSLVVGGTCALRRSDDGGRTFRRLPWTASDEQCSGGIRSLDFPSARVGVLLLGNGNVLRSTDAGRTWARRTAVPNTRATSAASQVEPSDLRFTSETTGFATTTGGDIFMTVDAGNTWKAVVAEPWSIRSVTFTTPAVGYAAGDAPAVLKTTDGGLTWAETPLPADAGGLREVRCASPDVCLGVTTGGDRLVRTVDGAATWESLAPSSVSLHAVGLPSTTDAVGVGEDGNTIVSTDAGSTFSPIGGLLTGQFSGLSARSAKVAYAFGLGGALARTTDGGQSWTEIDAATSDTVTDVSFLSDRVGFVLDDAGQLLRTDNAGDSYEILDTGTAQVPEAVRALDTKRVLLVGPAGVRRSDDGGRTFKPNVQKAVRNAPLFDVDRAGSTVAVYGPSTILLSGDGGRSFRPMRRPSKRVRINDLDIVSARTAYLLDARGPLYRTDDAGRHWRELPSLGTEVGSRLQFSDARHGWVTIAEFGDQPGGWVLRTDDGGKTWAPQLVSDGRLAAGGLAAGSASVGFTLTRANQLFATSTGGFAGGASRLTLTSPTKAVRKAGDAVRLNGRLSNARGGEHVLVSLRSRGSNRWLFQDVVVASNGTFTVVARIARTTQFVAQWAGNDARRGAGTTPLTVRVPGRGR